MSRAAFDPAKPFNALPRLPPKADVETRRILRACIGARAALAELKQASHIVPNAEMLINTLPVLEARASSEIENIVSTRRTNRSRRTPRPSRRCATGPRSSAASIRSQSGR